MKFLNETELICSNIVPYSCEASFLWICMLFQINFYYFKLWVSELCPSNDLRSPLQSSYCHKWHPIPIEKSCHFYHLLKCGTATLNWTHSIFSSKDSNIFVLRKIPILKISYNKLVRVYEASLVVTADMLYICFWLSYLISFWDADFFFYCAR